MAIIVVTGLDAKKFLQGQLTCDINFLSPGQIMRGAHCNIKGRVEALYNISLADEALRLQTPDDVAGHALQQLQHYARFSKVKLELLFSEENLIEDAARIAEMEAGIAKLHPETVGRFLPQELGLIELGAVDFKKGCYLGQEVVARLHYLGRLKKQLTYKILPEAAKPGALIEVNGQSAEVVDACGVNALVLA